VLRIRQSRLACAASVS